MEKEQSSKLTSNELFQRLLRHLTIVTDLEGAELLNDALYALHNETYKQLTEISAKVKKLL